MTSPPDDDAAPQRRGYRKGAERRAQILDQVIRMVAEQGVDASSLRSVAESLGTPYIVWEAGLQVGVGREY